MFPTTMMSSVACPVGGGGLGQCDGDSSSSWNMWVNQLQRIEHNQLEGIHKASQIVVIGPVGDIDKGKQCAGRVGITRQEIQIEYTTLVEGGYIGLFTTSVPTNWTGNFWIIF